VAIVVWVILALLFVGAELLTLSLVAIYAALGALAAAITAGVGGDIWIQLLVFAVVAVVALLLTRRPLLRLMSRTPQVPSNAPTVVGKRAVVVIAVEEGPGQRGQVRVGTEHWSARSEDERAIAEGVTVDVVRIDGVSLVVRPSGAAPVQTT
jgi:membrane protein implicated in regulation of membrane protease activity